MSDSLPRGAVLQPGRPTEEGELLRRKLDRRNLLTGVAVALLLHLLVVLGFLLIDLLGVRDLSDWSGPVLVKIGMPEAPEMPAPDPGPLPQQSEEPVSETSEIPENPAPADESRPAESAAPEPVPGGTTPAPAETPETAGVGTGSAENTESTQAPPAPAPVPSRVRGSEDGNNYEMNFEGTQDEVGRAAAYDFISSYMPLPETLPEDLVSGAKPYLGYSADFIRAEVERHWELSFGDYVKRRGAAGVVPMADRPYFWGILIGSLGYNINNAEWKDPALRPVVVEFTVSPSQGSRGAELSDFRIIRSTNDPKINEAVQYGLSRWVYYNDTGHDVRGRITYRFDDQ